ncbi:MAG: glycosyltransferase family 2 protein [Bacteroidota bacterium]|nr:glycosyltransferase family 2 protein [Bacteroidota bacterium]
MKISVCIATYNGEKYIAEQLRTILNQLNSEDEIIISDDSSTDNTIGIINSFNDKRIIIYPNQKFNSPIFNFEHAISKAKNHYIFLSDQDDLWVEGRVESMKQMLSEYDVVVCDHSIIDENGNIILKSYFEIIHAGPGVIKNLLKSTYFGCCMAFNRRILEIALPFPKHIPMHDIWIALVADLFYRTKFIDFPYTLYRKHSGNTSTASELKSNFSFMKKLTFRINTLRYLPLLMIRKIKLKS